MRFGSVCSGIEAASVAWHPLYPTWICADCGKEHGRWPEGHCASWHTDRCGWCGKIASVTEPRDFCYPPAPPVNRNLVQECDCKAADMPFGRCCKAPRTTTTRGE